MEFTRPGRRGDRGGRFEILYFEFLKKGAEVYAKAQRTQKRTPVA
jgi:hypothetical protein